MTAPLYSFHIIDWMGHALLVFNGPLAFEFLTFYSVEDAKRTASEWEEFLGVKCDKEWEKI